MPTVMPPRISDYADYHGFLRDFYNYKKSQNCNFSYRRFSSLAGIKSSNFLMLVMKRERRLSGEMAKSVAKAMKLPKHEADYFTALVKIELSQNPEEKQALERERLAAISKVVKHVLPQEKAEYFSHWYYPLIRELGFLPDFELSAAWITKKLSPLVSFEQAEKAVEILVHLGLWRIGASGLVKVSDTFLDTGPQDMKYGEIKLVNIHKENLRAWAQILSDIPPAERELGLINIPIDSAKLPELKRRIQRFQDEVIGWLQDETNPTQIVQLGTYLVPMTRDT